MPKCDVCGGRDSRHETVEEVFHVGDRYLLVEDIPATVCAKRGEKTIDAATAVGIRRRLRGESKFRRSMKLDDFGYHA